MKRKKVIMVPKGNVQKLAKAHGCSGAAVYDALAFKTETDRAKAIRSEAVKYYGGIQTTKIYF